MTAALCVAMCGSAIAQSKRGKRRQPKVSAPAQLPAAAPGEALADEATSPPGEAPAPASGDNPDPAASRPAQGSTQQPTPNVGAATGAADAQDAAPEPTAGGNAEEMAGGNAEEMAALRAELGAVMDDLVQARARVGILGKALFKTRVRIMIENDAAPDQVATRVVLSLDDAPVYRGDGPALPSDPAHPVFEGFIAPGEHTLSVEVEQRSRDDERYRYTLRESYRFQVVRDHRTDLKVELDDDSDIAEDFADDREGEYDVSTRLSVIATPLEDD